MNETKKLVGIPAWQIIANHPPPIAISNTHYCSLATNQFKSNIIASSHPSWHITDSATASNHYSPLHFCDQAFQMQYSTNFLLMERVSDRIHGKSVDLNSSLYGGSILGNLAIKNTNIPSLPCNTFSENLI
jgi:hypothetical protein